MAERGRRRPVVAVIAERQRRSEIEEHLRASGVRVSEAEAGSAIRVDADIVVLHVDNGPKSAKTVRGFSRRHPSAKIVCVLPDPVWKVARALLREGATAIVAEADVETALAPAVSSAYAGQLTLPSRLRSEIAQPVLSVREKQMLAMVVMGFSNPEISARLHVAESTVKSHLTSAFSKLGVRSRNEATALILDPAHGLGTGILEISGSAPSRDTPAAPRMVEAPAA